MIPKTQQFQQIVLDRIRFHLQQMVSDCQLNSLRDAEVYARVDQWAKALVFGLEVAVPGRIVSQEEAVDHFQSKAPADWWQSFRERWLPRWWLKRWPVKYRVEEKSVVTKTVVYNVCPHLHVQGNERHLQFLLREQK